MSQKALTILLVEDDVLLMMSFSDMLRDMGHDVVEAPSAAVALSLLGQDRKIDILITDIEMPDMNGQELVKLVRQKIANLPVIYSSGHRADKIADLDADPWARFLEKPFGMAELTKVFQGFSVQAAA